MLGLFGNLFDALKLFEIYSFMWNA